VLIDNLIFVLGNFFDDLPDIELSLSAKSDIGIIRDFSKNISKPLDRKARSSEMWEICWRKGAMRFESLT
ncbi:MAG: hypothetical protein SO363_00550, partial [Oscillospiraceae bacterium]|nr:hypothetical protein [Oscillospiraceae bacterium]